MLTYQFRRRTFRCDRVPSFPADVEVNFLFQPLQPFGMAPGGGATVKLGGKARIHFNANTGQQMIESSEPLGPLDVRIEEPNLVTALKGNQLTVRQRCESLDEVRELIETIYIGVPVLLAVEFADPPWVERVSGHIGDLPFNWELVQSKGSFSVTTQELQEQRVVSAWERFEVVGPTARRRLLAALHYFHVACRLRREEKSAGEFLAEAVLNLCKVLEVLYGPRYDSVRIALGSLGYTAEEIDRDFIPAMVLRNEFDVGHPSLALLTMTQLETLHRFAERAEGVFRGFLNRLLKAVSAGQAEIPDYQLQPADADARSALDKLTAQLASLGDRP